MESIYYHQLNTVDSLDSSFEKVQHLSSILRSILQVACVTSVELLIERTPCSGEDGLDVNYILTRIHQPSDGMAVELLDLMVPRIRSYLKETYLRGWFEPVKGKSNGLGFRLSEWVEFRNKKLGHGNADKQTMEIWAPKMESIVRDSLLVLGDAIPKLSASGSELWVNWIEPKLQMSAPLVYEGKAIVILKVVNSRGVWKLKAQELDFHQSRDVVKILRDGSPIVSFDNSVVSRFDCVELPSNRSILTNSPSRQTDIFEGRGDEIEKLTEWMKDFDSRTCLVYGDGGVGKTTLVLEFINRIFDGDVDLEGNLPEIISYHTAKMTRWTDSGIQHYQGVSTAVEDSIRELMFCFQEALDKKLYTTSGPKLIDRIETELKEQSLDRNDVVVVIDNAETLATTADEVEELSEIFRLISKKIGRLIITSRRREYIEARPVQITPLSELESVHLIKRLSNEYSAQSLIKAGDSRLRKVGRRLSYKPLLIDIFVRYISKTDVGIDDALDKLMQETGDDLVEFLYEDAWARMNESHQKVFVVLVNLTSPINHLTVGWACKEIGVQHDEWHTSLDQTYFGNMTSYGSGYEIEIAELARKFFLKKMKSYPEPVAAEVERIVSTVDSYAIQAEEIEKEYKKDRVSEAFDHQYAKAAKVASSKGEYKEASQWFELAVIEQPWNASLYDRFAWFLLNRMQDPKGAEERAKEALRLDSHNADIHLTMALIKYFNNDISSGDKHLKKSVSLGKPEGLGYLRMAIARYHSSKRSQNRDLKNKMLSEAASFLQKATENIKPGESYFNKNKRELDKYRYLVSSEMARIR